MSGSMVEMKRRIEELEQRVAEIEKRPRAGRPNDRSLAATAFLRKMMKKGPCAITRIMREGIAEGFNESLLRKAGRRLEVVRNKHQWALPSLVDDGEL